MTNIVCCTLIKLPNSRKIFKKILYCQCMTQTNKILDRKCSVVGVEGVEMAVMEFFLHQNLPYTLGKLQGNDLMYKAFIQPIKLYFIHSELTIFSDNF